MSGGSLNYLCWKEPEELSNCIDDLECVKGTVSSRGYLGVAKDIQDLIDFVISSRDRIEELFDPLRDICKAVEWTYSSDYSVDSIDRAVAAYCKRKEGL